MGSRLYVGNIPFNTDETQLRTFFEEGNRQVASVKIIMDRETGRPRGFAFVDMATDEEAQGAITAFHGKEFGGRTLTVNEARERQPGERPGGFDRAPRPGGYQGGGGGGDRGGYQGGGENRGGYQGGGENRGGYQGGGDRGGYQGGAPRPAGGYQGGGDNRGGYQGGGDNRGGYQGGGDRGGYQGGGDNRGYPPPPPPSGDDRGNRGGYQGGDDRGNRGGYQGGGDRGGYQGGGDRGGDRGGFGGPPAPGGDDRGNRTRDYERRTQNKNRGGAYERDRGRRNFDDDDESY